MASKGTSTQDHQNDEVEKKDNVVDLWEDPEAEAIAKAKSLLQELHPTDNAGARVGKKEKIKKAKIICSLYAEGEYSLESCCKVVGVNVATFRNWAQPLLTESDISSGNYRNGFIREVYDLYKATAKQQEANYLVLLKNKTREGLLKKAAGGSTIERHKTYERVVKEDGTEELKLISEKVVNKHLQPDTTALIFIAKNLDADNFQEKQVTEHSGSINVESELARKTDAELKELREQIQKQKESEDGL